MTTPGPAQILSEFLMENASNIGITALAFACVQHYIPVVKALAIFGMLCGFRLLYALSIWIWAAFLRPAKNVRDYGAWALVTGCTDGIGKALCHQFAQRGLNLVLVGRSESKLRDMIQEFQALYKGVDYLPVVVDLCGPDLRAEVSRVERAIEGLEVGMLVNNAGMSYPYARFFHEVDDELLTNLLRINVEAMTRMVHMVLPGMLKRRKGCIINMGSGAASILSSDPLYSLYAATKGFVDQFSKSLNVEYRDVGIDIQCQVPLYVATKMTRVRKPSLACPSPDTYAQCAMRWIGYEARVTPYFLHSLLWFIRGLFREHTLDANRLKTSLNIRKRGIARDAQKKQEEEATKI
ncbi:very-long-chain 3-oxoacyl-CoA reductase 1 [Selaginella moellendorffii]|nr:very-long-chain 3-oxoacyl-CoA reductase 1 [Selaginella moellendorffii]|eukprot:XP_002984908.2 very-long-chain 3-oxoacyl-CoA reductase 1 [Selaginella moellendorffii]